MAFNDITAEGPGKAYMLANEAVVRAALESDVKVYSTYPGSPTVEILDSFERALDRFDFKMDIAVNEKLALETAVGASMVGMRSFSSMKSVGMNVAADSLYVMAYTGVKGGCVVLIADDPHAHSSQSEQDGRWFGYTAYVPMLDPSSPQEAMDMVRAGYDISEKHGSIVLLRTTTRINHQSGVVKLGEMKRSPFKKIKYDEIRTKYSSVGSTAREGKLKLLKKIEKIKEDSEISPFNTVEYFDGEKLIRGRSPEPIDIGIVTSGVSYGYAVEALIKLGLPAGILKIGFINPFPEKKIADFISGFRKIIVVEELSPYLENFVEQIARSANPDVQIMGKGSHHFSEYSEYSIPLVTEVIAEASGMKVPFDYDEHMERTSRLADIIPPRPPIFCAGCPHRGTFTALKRAVGNKSRVFFSNDIGCYTMMVLPPFDWTDSQLCMGASLGIAAGVDFAAEERVIVAIGDSTIFHAGLTGIVNAVHNRHSVTIVVLHNSVTAMTGQQSHPAHEKMAGGRDGIKLDIESVLRGLGVEKIVNVDSFGIRKNVKMMKEALDHDGVSAIISHGECALYHFRNLRRQGGKSVPYYVDKDLCRAPYICIKGFLCPAISIDETDGKSIISPDICVGCGECAQMCGFGAIKSTATLHGGEDRTYYTIEDYREYERNVERKEEVAE
ncbi:MAG: thiamine pyrophosphate-dependent enzyme [Thermoplasmatota archaeon]